MIMKPLRTRLQEARKRLGPLVPSLPSFKTVISELRPAIADIIFPEK